MSDEIVLTARRPIDRAVDASQLTIDDWAGLSAAEIGRLSVRVAGRGGVPLGELFEVRGERATRVRIAGDLASVEGLGARLELGALVIEGDVGREVGARMRGGRVEVRGNAGYGAGSEMSGGLLEIHGNTGARAGGAPLGAKRGMSGGEIVIRGAAGPELGSGMRRGLIVVAGAADEGAARGAIAGTVVVFGATGPGAGQWAKRVTILALGPVKPIPTYRYACTYQPQYVGFVLKYLGERHRMPVTREQLSGNYRRYSGDLAELGAGEILEWTAA